LNKNEQFIVYNCVKEEGSVFREAESMLLVKGRIIGNGAAFATTKTTMIIQVTVNLLSYLSIYHLSKYTQVQYYRLRKIKLSILY